MAVLTESSRQKQPAERAWGNAAAADEKNESGVWDQEKVNIQNQFSSWVLICRYIVDQPSALAVHGLYSSMKPITAAAIANRKVISTPVVFPARNQQTTNTHARSRARWPTMEISFCVFFFISKWWEGKKRGLVEGRAGRWEVVRYSLVKDSTLGAETFLLFFWCCSQL